MERERKTMIRRWIHHYTKPIFTTVVLQNVDTVSIKTPS